MGGTKTTETQNVLLPFDPQHETIDEELEEIAAKAI